jgi:hypothetical protein
MAKEHAANLSKLGLDAPGLRVVSLESDFTKGWNQFTLEFGEPTAEEMIVLKREWAKVAGDADALIAHVERCAKIDEALIELLSQEGLGAYTEAKATALKAYNKATATAWKAYNKAKAPAEKAYNKAKATAWIFIFRKNQNRVKHLRD